MLDVMIVGGSSAGLSAALVLGRARRRVLVFDDGKPCNRFSHASHGFLTRDGVAPADLVGIAREQLQPYESVTLINATAAQVGVVEGGFSVTTAAGDVHTARKLLLATGLTDTLPAIDGIGQFWGRSVFHCPYCDGWEVRDQPIVVYNDSETALHQIMLLDQWTKRLTLATGGTNKLTDEERARIQKHGIRIIDTPATRVEGGEKIERVVFADGSVVECAAMFVRLVSEQRTTFPRDLGCAFTAQGLVQVSAAAETSVPGVYAAGDIANPARSVALAVGQGATAAFHINHALAREDF